MLRLSITLLIIAIIAAVLGFGGLAGAAAGMAEIVFYIFIVLFVLSLLFGRRTRVSLPGTEFRIRLFSLKKTGLSMEQKE